MLAAENALKRKMVPGLSYELSKPQNPIKSHDHFTILSCFGQQCVSQLRSHRDLRHTHYN